MKLSSTLCTLAAAFLVTLNAMAGGKDTKVAAPAADAAVHPALATPPVVVVQPSMEPLAYMMAWQSAANATHHTDAVQLTHAMADLVGLPTGPAHDALERFLDAELAASPGRFDASAEPLETLSQMLRENVGSFQRILSPALSEVGYARYQKLLDSLNIKAN